MGIICRTKMPYTEEQMDLFKKFDNADTKISKAEAEQIFGIIDADSNGGIDKDELMSWGKEAFEKFEAEKAEAIFKAVDKNSDGELSMEEWVTSLREMGLVE